MLSVRSTPATQANRPATVVVKSVPTTAATARVLVAAIFRLQS